MVGAFYFRLDTILLKHLSLDSCHSEGGRIREEMQRSNMLKIGKKSLTLWCLNSWHPWVWQSRECGFPSHCCCVIEKIWFSLPPEGSCGSWVVILAWVTLACCLLLCCVSGQYPEISISRDKDLSGDLVSQQAFSRVADACSSQWAEDSSHS